jgi:hypothetical protein
MTFTPAHLEEGFATTWAKRRWARRLRAGESREPIFLESSTPHAGITAPMGLRLSAGPGPAPDVWLRMQVQPSLAGATSAATQGSPVPSWDRETGFRRPRIK